MYQNLIFLRDIKDDIRFNYSKVCSCLKTIDKPRSLKDTKLKIYKSIFFESLILRGYLFEPF